MDHKSVRIDEETGLPAHDRVYDKSKRAKLEFFLESNWRTVLTILWLLAGWYAANVYDPIRAIPQIIIRDSTRAQQHEDIEHKVDRMEGAILTLSRISCFGLDARDRIKYNIDCTNIPLPEQGGTSTR